MASSPSPSSIRKQAAMLTRLLLILLVVMVGPSSSADLLQNPDFESPPPNVLPTNSTDEFIPLNQTITSLPGWSFEETVLYVNAGKTVSLPRNGSHAVQLGPDGKINQTFTASGPAGQSTTYLLTITLVYSSVGSGGNCTSSATTVVSAPDSRTEVQSVDGAKRKPWESFGVYLGSWDAGESVNIVIESASSDVDSSLICWPIIDSVLLKSFQSQLNSAGNLLPNSGFELGPAFLADSAEGVLLSEALSLLQSPLTQWSILGTIRYIDSNHFSVPAGNAAVEFVVGNSSGIQTAVSLAQGSSYSMSFTLGDAKDDCFGELRVRAQAGSVLKNYSILTNGTGSRESFSLTFEANTGPTPISFIGLNVPQTKDVVFCGAVIDDIVLHASMAVKAALSWNFMAFLVVFAAAAAV